MKKTLINATSSLVRWFDTDAVKPVNAVSDTEFDWLRCIPFIAMHLVCLGVFIVSWSPVAVIVAVALYLLRMFAITGFYHRYFSHHSFKSGRLVQFLFALVGCMAVQRGPLWWAAHHRHHHRHSDEDQDVHSPTQRGFWWSHMLWFTCEANFATDYTKVKDFSKFPELRFLNRYDMLIPVLYALAMFFLGMFLEVFAPQLGASGGQMLIWGFFISTVVLYHATFTINSLAHVLGKRRYNTNDNSRNNWLLAMITLGEGWHNNHHRFPGSVRQGHYWWEIDITWYVLALMSKLGLVWDLKPVPARVLNEAKR